MPITVDSATVEGHFTAKSHAITPLFITTANQTTALPYGTQSSIVFTGSTAGQVAQFGNATTYPLGYRYRFTNNASVPVIIEDSSGFNIAYLLPDQIAEVELLDNSTSAGTWGARFVDYEAQGKESFEDFFFNTFGATSNPFGFVSIVVNGGTTTLETTPTDGTYEGKVILATGTTNNNTGRAAADPFNSVNKMILGTARRVFEARVLIPTLSTASISFFPVIGLVDTNAVGLPTNGVFFYYLHSTNGGAWQAHARSASTSSLVNSAVTVVANTWYKLKFIAYPGNVDFFIDGNYIGSAVANIPTAALRPIVHVQKTGGNSNQSRTLHVDYLAWKMGR